MKKSLFIPILLIFLILPLGIAAVEPPPEEIPTGITSPTALLALIETVGNWLFSFLLVGAMIAIVVAAYQFITAAGSSEKVTSARNWVIYALAGVAVAVLSKGLVTFVRTLLTD